MAINRIDDHEIHERERVNARIQSRNWFGTIWRESDIIYIQGLKTTFIAVSADDHTEEGQLHWHALLQFANPRTRPATENAHWEKPKNVLDALKYITDKGEPRVYEGEIQIRSQNREEWKGFVEKCKVWGPREMIDSEWSNLYARYRGFAGEVHQTFAIVNIIDGDLENEWLYGEPGTGKTRYAWNTWPDLFVKSLNKWWDGYAGQETVLLDDWDPRQEVLTYYLKIWADRYPFRAEIKGNGLLIRPKRIIVTSNYKIDECFQNPADIDAIKRRFKVKHFSTFGN